MGVRARNVYPCSTVTLVCAVSLRLALSQSAVSFLSRWGVVTCERICMARFQSRAMFGVLAAFAPISLGPLSFRGPSSVRRHVLLSGQ